MIIYVQGDRRANQSQKGYKLSQMSLKYRFKKLIACPHDKTGITKYVPNPK
jgi:hypothetical protein